MAETNRELQGILGNTGEHQGMLGNTKLYQRKLENIRKPREYQVMSGNIRYTRE